MNWDYFDLFWLFNYLYTYIYLPIKLYIFDTFPPKLENLPFDKMKAVFSYANYLANAGFSLITEKSDGWFFVGAREQMGR